MAEDIWPVVPAGRAGADGHARPFPVAREGSER